MKKLFYYLLTGLAILLWAGAFIFGFLSYFVRSSGTDNIILDGLGRQLELTPMIVKFLYVSDTMWPGWGWAIFDWLMFFGLIGIAYLLYNFATKLDPIKS